MGDGGFETAEFEGRLEDVRKLLKGADTALSGFETRLGKFDELMSEPREGIFELLDDIHIKLKKIHEDVESSFDGIRKKYADLRNGGLELIDKYIREIREKKGELIQIGYNVDEGIRKSELPESLLEMREKEVVLFNAIEDCYRFALQVTSKIKDLDSKASTLGYEFAQFSGKLYGLNRILVVIGDSVESGKLKLLATASGSKSAQRLSIDNKGEHEFEHYIR